jgi:two-component system, NtrC family, sensor histidine kinase HydH
MEIAKEFARTERGKKLFDEQLLAQRSNLDRLFSKLLLVQWAAAVVVAVVWSPIGWADKQNVVGGFLPLAILAGGLLALTPLVMTRLMAGASLTRHVMAAAQMLFSALFIHLSGGRIETHFHIFGSLAWLAFYLDWQILVTATIVVAAEHMLRGLFVPESVYGVMHAGHWRFVEHALWVVFEDVILFIGCVSGLRSLREGTDRQAQLETVSESEQNKSAALELAMIELRRSVA